MSTRKFTKADIIKTVLSSTPLGAAAVAINAKYGKKGSDYSAGSPIQRMEKRKRGMMEVRRGPNELPEEVPAIE